MSLYLYFIGTMNTIGALLLVGALSDDFSDKLLRRWTSIIRPDTRFVHSEYSRVWLWWAIIGTAFFGPLNLVAASWPPEFARTIVYGDIFCYSVFELLAIAMTFSDKYGPGKYVTHFLWIGQAGWGVIVALW